MYDSAPTRSAASDPETLLGHAAWVRRLARALVRSGDPAADRDDVEQQTWLAALGSARKPASDAAAARGWLRAVARNVARRFARDHAGRRRREEATAPDEALAPVDDAVARAELHGKVVAAVLALGEPYRSTLIRRFLDERTPSQIAALEHVPVETVKTRLKRGLAQLRERFAEELGEERGGERDWRRALLVLVPARGVESAVLAGAGSAFAVSMKWKLLAAALVALATVAAFVSSRPGRDGRGSSTDESAPAVAAAVRNAAPAASTMLAADRERLDAPVPAITPDAATPLAGAPALRAVPRLRIPGVVRDPTGAPVAGAWVWLTDARSSWTRDPTAWFGAIAAWPPAAEPAGFGELPRTRTDRDGCFEFVSFERASWRVAAWHPGLGAVLSPESRADAGRRAPAPLELTLRPLVGLRGRIVDERGAPVPQAMLQLTVTSGGEPIDFELPRPWQRRDDATFELAPMPAVAFRGSASAFGYADASFAIDDVRSLLPLEVEIVLRRDPQRIRVGRIVATRANGSLADALLPNRREWELDGAAGRPCTRVACSIVRFTSPPPRVGARLVQHADPAGEVHLASGTYAVDRPPSRVASHLGLVVREVVVAVAEDAPLEPAPELRVDAALVPWQPATGVLRVRVHGPPERMLDRAGGALWVKAIGGSSRGGLWMPIRPGSAPDEFVVEHVPAGRVAVHYLLPGVARIAGEAEVTAGCESSLDLEVRSGTASVLGFVEGLHGGPLRNVGSVQLYARQGGRTLLPALEIAAVVGERFFSFESLAQGEYALLWQRGTGPAVTIVTASDAPVPVLLKTADAVEVTIAAHFATGERPDAMSLRVLRADGTPEVDEIGTTGWDLGAGQERSVVLTPGRHRVELFAQGAEPAAAEFDAGVTRRLDVPLRRR